MSKVNVLFVAVVVVAVIIASAGPRVAEAQQPLELTMDANGLTVREGGGALLRYRYSGVPFKPYVQELFTPRGINVLLDAPPDHLHHHALMFACAVNHVDFWGEAPNQPGGHFEPLPGKQAHVVFDRTAVAGPEGRRLARFGEYVTWLSQPNEKPLLFEYRTVTAGQLGKPKATVVMWTSRLSAPDGKDPVVLTGSHYHGLGLRFIRSMDATGEFRNPDNDPGVVFRGEERLTHSRWCAYTAQADGETVTAAVFDHPENPRHPATWFMMAKPFAYMSATLRLHEEPLKVFPYKPVLLKYGVALWDGRPETEQIDTLYKEWAGMAGTGSRLVLDP